MIDSAPRGGWRRTARRWVARLRLGAAGRANCGWVWQWRRRRSGQSMAASRLVVDFYNGSGKSGRRSRLHRRRQLLGAAFGALNQPVGRGLKCAVLPWCRYTTPSWHSTPLEIPTTPSRTPAPTARPRRSLRRFPTQPQLAGVATTTRRRPLTASTPSHAGSAESPSRTHRPRNQASSRSWIRSLSRRSPGRSGEDAGRMQWQCHCTDRGRGQAVIGGRTRGRDHR
jgi:hypothetical protein